MVACRCKCKISENKNKNNEYHCYVLSLLVIWELEKRIIQQYYENFICHRIVIRNEGVNIQNSPLTINSQDVHAIIKNIFWVKKRNASTCNE